MNEENQLKRQMKTRHITMLALGGAIGAGLFKGSGEAIDLAGPSVLLAFIFCGLILFMVMTGLGKLVLEDQKQHGLLGWSNLIWGCIRLILSIGFTGRCG